jgi:hypothetical protein
MVRLTWLQFRLSAAVAVLALALVGILVALTGPHLAHVYDTVVAPCLAQGGDCKPTVSSFLGTDSLLQSVLTVALLAAPALLGIFWGAPLLAREIERSTFRLAWTQSVSRSRWLAIKLSFIGLASMIVAGVLSLMVTWWFRPIDRVNANRFVPGIFDERGVVALGYAVFAFMLGVTAGLLIVRIVPAMVTTLVLFVGSRLVVTSWIRPHFLSPVKQTLPFVWGPGAGIAQGSSGGGAFVIPPTPNLPNAWVYSNLIIDQAGHAPSSQFLQSTCPALTGGLDNASSNIGTGISKPSPSGGPTAQQVHSCVASIATNYHQVVTYQPASRYWLFQWYETAIFVGLALVLAGICFWWVRRRLT